MIKETGKTLIAAPGFDSQHPHGGSQPSVTPASGHLTPSSALCGHCMQMVQRHAGRQNTHTYIKKINILKRHLNAAF